jgi:hypothetical protein
VLPGVSITGSFASKPAVQLTMMVSDKVAPDDPEKTFLSFSDNVNNSVITKSVDDEINQDKSLVNPEDG